MKKFKYYNRLERLENHKQEKERIKNQNITITLLC